MDAGRRVSAVDARRAIEVSAMRITAGGSTFQPTERTIVETGGLAILAGWAKGRPRSLEANAGPARRRGPT